MVKKVTKKEVIDLKATPGPGTYKTRTYIGGEHIINLRKIYQINQFFVLLLIHEFYLQLLQNFNKKL